MRLNCKLVKVSVLAISQCMKTGQP